MCGKRVKSNSVNMIQNFQVQFYIFLFTAVFYLSAKKGLILLQKYGIIYRLAKIIILKKKERKRYGKISVFPDIYDKHQ